MIKHSAAALLLVSGSALATDEIRFNHIGAEYLYSETDVADGDGFAADLNVALTSYLFADVKYSTRTLERSGSEADVELFSGGLGGNYALNEAKSIQLFGAITWEQLDVSSGAVPDDGGDGGEGGEGGEGGGGGIPTCAPEALPIIGGECLPGVTAGSKALNEAALAGEALDGFGVKAGVRALVMPALELHAAYGLRDYDDADEDFYTVGVNYSIGDWTAVLKYEAFGELKDIGLGVRYTFGKEDGGGSFW